MKYLLPFFFTLSAVGQTYAIGANIGYGFYNNGTIHSSTESVEAGIRNRFAGGIDLGWEFSKYVSAQFDYLYHDGHPFLQGAGTKTDIQGQSHALTVEGLFHFKPRDARFRPFLAAPHHQ